LARRQPWKLLRGMTSVFSAASPNRIYYLVSPPWWLERWSPYRWKGRTGLQLYMIIWVRYSPHV
jgi:hypothetical protein